MYSYEIQQLLELKNYLLTNKEYLEAFNPDVSSQIETIIYNSWDDYYYIHTNDGYSFDRVRVRKEEE